MSIGSKATIKAANQLLMTSLCVVAEASFDKPAIAMLHRIYLSRVRQKTLPRMGILGSDSCYARHAAFDSDGGI